MSTVKISALPELIALSDADAIPVVHSGITKRITGLNIQQYLLGNLTVANVTLGTNVPGGNIQISANFVPVVTNTITLGSPDKKFQSVYVGPGSVYITDTVLGTNAELTVVSGVLQINGANQLQVGQLKFVNNTIESTSGATDIQIGLSTSSANLVLNRDTVLSNNKTISWGLNTGDYETEKYFVIGLDENGGIESATPSAYLETMGNIALNIDVNGNQWVFGNDGSFTLPGGIKTADTTTDIILGTDDGSDTGSITAYRTYQLRDGNDNVLMQIQNEDGIGKLKFNGGSDGIWYDGGVVIKGVGYHSDYYGIQPMSFNSASGQVTYGQLNYAHFQGFPRLPNFSSDTTANTAIAGQTVGGDFYNTPQAGQMYFDTTVHLLKTYSGTAWVSSVASVTATGPISSSGGTTPNISISQASGSTSGYLSSTDWTTFNNKTSNTGTVTSITASTTPVNGLSLSGGAITTSGTVAITGTLSGITNSNLSGTAGITNANLANSSVTVTAGTGMTGGGSVSLGGSVTLTNAGVTSIVAGTNVTVSGSTGAVTINAASNGVGGNQLVYVLNGSLSYPSAKNTLTSIFGLTSGVTLTTNTRYQYEMVVNMAANKAGVLSYALALGGSAAVAQHNYTWQGNKTTTIDGYTAGITMMSYNATGANITAANAVADTSTFTHHVVHGTIDVTTGGTVNFMVSQDQNTPITWLAEPGSYIKLLPVGPIGANTADGTWA